MRPAILLVTALLLGLASAQNDPLLLYGGPDRDVFLGCLTCSRYARDSVTNPNGTYGAEHGYASIHNAHGPYGSRYQDTSVCNPYARRPPAVVDERGRLIGYLTLNRHLPRAILQDDLLAWLRNDVCG